MINLQHNAVVCSNFNKVYFDIVNSLYGSGELVKSRNGNTKEFMNFKTVITNPSQRCIAGSGRNINIFFLLAEALWIFSGRKDVRFLDIFNSRMKDYSDDGVTFHAPYGHRLRNAGLHSSINNTHKKGVDQIAIAVQMVEDNPEDRRIVLQIWDYVLDLGTDCKDIPCNDLWMWKVRGGKLHTTIANRSNDINWGLTTNVFQFSFLSEILCNVMRLEMGTQTHNSQSLHLYLDGKMGELTNSLINTDNQNAITYGEDIFNCVFDFEYSKSAVSNKARLQEVDFVIDSMISELIMKNKMLQEGIEPEQTNNTNFMSLLLQKSKYLFNIYALLEVYISWKNKTNTTLEVYDFLKQNSIYGGVLNKSCVDYNMLAMSFFEKKAKPELQNAY